MNSFSKDTFLTTEEVARLLGLPEVTVQRWEHQGKIPYKIINGQVSFKKSEIIRWAKAHDLTIREKHGKSKDLISEHLLTDAIVAGGIYHNIDGDDVYTVFHNALNNLGFIDKKDHDRVFDELLNREELASTGIGNGIAIPHTRNRLDLNLNYAHVAIIFLNKPLPFNAIDGKPVTVLFMIFTTSVKEHLKMLSRISFVLQKSQLKEMLAGDIEDQNLITQIKQIESDAR
ncbi:MAG: PTS sugar transporter subunit IIA [Calditrichae bacterium]|nr:PTS sugar transporter subunit IIA [Calditrichia bacterium]